MHSARAMARSYRRRPDAYNMLLLRCGVRARRSSVCMSKNAWNAGGDLRLRRGEDVDVKPRTIHEIILLCNLPYV